MVIILNFLPSVADSGFFQWRRRSGDGRNLSTFFGCTVQQPPDWSPCSWCLLRHHQATNKTQKIHHANGGRLLRPWIRHCLQYPAFDVQMKFAGTFVISCLIFVQSFNAETDIHHKWQYEINNHETNNLLLLLYIRLIYLGLYIALSNNWFTFLIPEEPYWSAVIARRAFLYLLVFMKVIGKSVFNVLIKPLKYDHTSAWWVVSHSKQITLSGALSGSAVTDNGICPKNFIGCLVKLVMRQEP